MEFKRIELPFKVRKKILALGTQTKNTVCFAKKNLAYLSNTHPDLSNLKDFLEFKRTVDLFLKQKPKIIAYDLHPDYVSSRYALKLSSYYSCLVPIQHHHAHIISCMLDNELSNQKVIGVAFDGTGLGTDNTLWGAEFFICDYRNFKRMAHLKEVCLLGGERAILEPWRLVFFWLNLAYKDPLRLDIAFIKGLDKKRYKALKNIFGSGLKYPFSSSMGRLFDAVASLVLKIYKVNFEAEAAIELEKMAKRFFLSETKGYPFRIIKKQTLYILDPLPIFKEIIKDLKKKQSPEKIAYRFHLSVAEMIKKTCLVLRKDTFLNKVVLSGGVFQNNLLLNLSLDLLYKEGFKVYFHKEIPCNDAGVSLGQLGIVNFKK